MAEETHPLKRDSTMIVTATEGNAILEKLGKVDEDAKTRAQQKKIEDDSEQEATPKMERTTTMAATAKEGAEILDGAELGKTRGETAKLEDENKEVKENEDDEDEKPSLQRASTMPVTAKEGAAFLAASGGVFDGTRSEAKKVEEALKATEEEGKNSNGTTNDDEDESSKLKRKGTMQATAEEGEEFLKRQKLAESDEKEAVKEVEA